MDWARWHACTTTWVLTADRVKARWRTLRLSKTLVGCVISEARYEDEGLTRTGSRGNLYMGTASDCGSKTPREGGPGRGDVPSRSIMVDNDQRDLRLYFEIASLLPRVAHVKSRRSVSVVIRHVRDAMTTVLGVR